MKAYHARLVLDNINPLNNRATFFKFDHTLSRGRQTILIIVSYTAPHFHEDLTAGKWAIHHFTTESNDENESDDLVEARESFDSAVEVAHNRLKNCGFAEVKPHHMVMS